MPSSTATCCISDSPTDKADGAGRRGVIVLPTGAGKTVIAMKAIEDTLGPLHTDYVTARTEALAIRNLSAPAT